MTSFPAASFHNTLIQLEVPGLRQRFRTTHLTDAHICFADDEGPHREACLRRRSEWSGSDQFSAHFASTMRVVAAEADILMFTGDVVDSPTKASIDFVTGTVRNAGTPALYIPGNHDWCFYDDKPDPALRSSNYPLLDPLFGMGPAPAQRGYCVEIDGVRFLGIDNSTYQVDSSQLELAERAFASGAPTVLLLHIPILQEKLSARAIEVWGCPILMGAKGLSPEVRKNWAIAPDLETTDRFIEAVRNAPNLLAIFCGHVHFAHSEPIGKTAVQYVGAPVFANQYSIVEFLPA